MQTKKYLIFLFVILCMAKHVDAQNKIVDSLKTELQNAKQDTTRLRIYIALDGECQIKDNLIYAEPAVALADKLISQSKNEKERNKILKQKADAFNYIIAFYYYKFNSRNISKVLEYGQKRLSILQEIKDTINIVNSMLELSIYYQGIGNLPKALEFSNKAFSSSKETHYKKGMAISSAYIGDIYRDQGEKKQALSNYEQSLSLLFEIKDTSDLVNTLLAIGGLDRTPKYYNKALALCKGKNWLEKTFSIYQYLGIIYQEKKQYNISLLNFQKSLTIANEMKNRNAVKIALDCIGSFYSKLDSIDKALDYHYKGLKIATELNMDYEIVFSYLSLTEDYFKQNNYKKAKDCIEKVQKVEKSLDINSIILAEKLALQIDSASGNFNGAFEHYKKYIIAYNKLISDEVRKTAQKEKYQNEFDKQNELNKKEQEKKDALATEETKKQKIVRNSFVGGFALMLLLVGVTYRNYKKKQKDNILITKQKIEVEKQKHLVEEKNQEITDSIQYALRIQTAILPPQKVVKQYLENSFIVYKPKDIVAGDFYWMEAIQFDKFSNSQILFAACDCTGHGVPGAMVSVVCHNALNRAVREFGLTKPSDILDKTTEIVKENFSKSEDEIIDGMDISLCSLSLNPSPKEREQNSSYTLQWAGANNPLWIVRAGHSELVSESQTDGMPKHDDYLLIETKADKQSIGNSEDSKAFTNHEFTVYKGDSIYIFTDGFADQFGGEGEKKLTKRRFKELILSIQNKTMEEQGIALDNFIVDYRKEIEQTDDVLVMGVKI